MTIQEIIDKSVERPIGGRQTILEGDGFVISIVGGDRGLYGDFKDTFELAIIETKFKNFITRDLIESATDDVIGWATIKETEKIVNDLLFAD